MKLANTPNNPSGAMYSRSELQAIADVLVNHNVAVLLNSPG